MSDIPRPALRYHGGKWRLASWILSCFPPHVCYVEPFGGGGSVLLQKQPSFVEVYNDLSGDVVNFFRVLRERGDELRRAIELTPYARAEFLAAQEPTDDPLEAARRFYVWSWQGRGRAGVQEPGGWRFIATAARGTTVTGDWNNTAHLAEIVSRLKLVQIECGEAETVIQRYDTPDTLFYVDPPYVASTRGARWGNSAYTHEMTDDDHERLAGLLHTVRGMVILSGYPSDLYNRLYADWRAIHRRQATDNGTKEAVEVLWLSPALVARRMGPLFAMELAP